MMKKNKTFEDRCKLPEYMEAFVQEIIDREGLRDFVPLTSSVDVRHDDYDRICPVDPNRYPQGFNNVCKEDYKAFANLIDRMLSKEITKLHVVEEEYGEKNQRNHPYYDSLKALKQMLSLTRVGHGNVSSSNEIVVEKISTTMNILNTSYPSDIELDGMLRTDTEDIETHTRLNTVKSVSTRSILQVDHHDPEWYNTYEKHSLFQTLQRWIGDFVLIWKRRWIESPTSSEEILSSNTLNARFDLFPENCDTVYGDKLGALIYSKLYPPASSFETPWRKVFVKDDNGCNGVGMLVIGRKDVPKKTESFRLKLSDRKTLRPRNKIAFDRRLVLQEGIPTCLRNQDTGAQLEIVLMLANGHVYNYFAREIDMVSSPREDDLSKESETKGREEVDMCTSLNIPGARFIQRDVFETSPQYRDAFERVQKQWWKYLLTGRLCILAMAKQKQDFVRGRRMSISSSSSSMSSVSLIGIKKRVKTKKETKKKKKKSKHSENETQNEFSRRVSGILMRAINSRTKSMLRNKTSVVRNWRTLVGKILKNEILKPLLPIKVRKMIEDIVIDLAHTLSDSKCEDETCTYQLRVAFTRIDCVARNVFATYSENIVGVPFVLPLKSIDTTSQEDLTKLAFHNILTLAPIWNLILDKASCDVKWLLSVLHKTSKTDMFVRRQMEILKRGTGVSRRRLSLIRQDYLPNYDDRSETTPFQFFKAVEYNTIAVAFASFSEELARVHNRFNSVFENPNPPLLSVESNCASKSYASALALAHKSYTKNENDNTPHVCLFVHENDHLDLDQELIIRHLLREGVFAFKACFETSKIEIRKDVKGYDDDGNICLFVNDRHVSVAYFHATWSPSQFKSETDWLNRELIERSSAVKVPTIASQLVGTKKVQEALSHRETLVRFLKLLNMDPNSSIDHSDEYTEEILRHVRSNSALNKYKSSLRNMSLIDRLLGTSVTQIDPHHADSRDVIKEAMHCAEDWVLKPQREGGGNNLFGQELCSALDCINIAKEYYTLMRKIKSKARGPRNYVSKSGVSHRQLGVSELGIFTALFVDHDEKKKKTFNKVGGAFCRTKLPDREEGGVCSGNGYLDIPYPNSF